MTARPARLSASDENADVLTDFRRRLESLESAMQLLSPVPRNLLINGAALISQRPAATGITTDGVYGPDGWLVRANAAGTFTLSTATGPGGAFASAVQVAVTSAVGLVATSYALLTQRVEGSSCARIQKGTPTALPLALSFWVKASVAGVHIVELEALGRTVSLPYTVDVSGVWQRVTLVFPPDASGPIAHSFGVGMAVNWWVAGGSNFASGPLNTVWGTGGGRNTGGVNGATSGATFAVSGAQLEAAYAPTPFEWRPFPQELRLCQRYYFDSRNAGQTPSETGQAATGTYVATNVHYPVQMRAAPTVHTFGYSNTIDSVSAVATSSDIAGATVVPAQVSDRGYIALNTTGLGTGGWYWWWYTADASL